MTSISLTRAPALLSSLIPLRGPSRNDNAA